jgi:RimJ/RimL family protein N-acetyltransferase
MEKTPHEAAGDSGRTIAMLHSLGRAQSAPASGDWRDGIPALKGLGVTLREVRISDAPSLFARLTNAEVSRFISPPPASVEAFERYISWTHRQRAAGQYICFAVVPDGADEAVGLFRVRQLEPGFVTAEWGFALAPQYWGTGLFVEGARLVIDMVFTQVGTHRLEARAAVKNGRANGALAKIGAVREAVLRRAFLKDGDYVDQNLWAIIEDEWLQAKAVWGPKMN